jgi:type IV secretory pathway VirB10-like protein
MSVTGTVRRALVRRVLLLLLALVVVIALPACGEDEPTKEEVIEQADEICKDAEEDIEEIQDVPQDELGQAFEEGGERAQEAVDDLKAIEVPDEDKDVWDDFIEESEKQPDYFEEAEQAFEEGDNARVDEIAEESQEAEEEAAQLAEDYGMDKCAETSEIE